MNRVLVWDYTGDSSQWLEKNLSKNDVEVIQTITSQEPVPDILLKKDAWDFLMIFERRMRNTFETIIKTLKLPPEKIVYALDTNHWVQRPKAIYSLLGNSMGWIRRRFFLNELKNLNAFHICTVEGLSYVATSTDPFRLPNMFVSRTNWASKDMKRFHELSKQYYDVDESAGYFLDLGANIGTTGLYFCKNLAPNLKLLAFEPDPENYKMHRVNMILNDLEEITDLVNCGLGNEASELMLYRNSTNTGTNGFIKQEQSTPIAIVKVIPLDSYLAENKIAAQDVKYIWIDTEGFEDKVLLGAKNLLRENPAPIFMECNLNAWDNSGFFEDMMTLLAESYSHFILFDLKDRNETLHPLEDLRTLERPNNSLGQMGDIFLIKKGAIV